MIRTRSPMELENNRCNLVGPSGNKLQVLGRAQVNLQFDENSDFVSLPIVAN
jgi:hypothetical protein